MGEGGSWGRGGEGWIQDEHHKRRVIITSYMQQNAEIFYHTVHETTDVHLERTDMQSPSIWATVLEIVTASCYRSLYLYFVQSGHTYKQLTFSLHLQTFCSAFQRGYLIGEHDQPL